MWGLLRSFAESGLLFGFFLPGDSLLFTAGFLASGPPTSRSPAPVAPAGAGGLPFAAVIGDQVGYIMGMRVGPAIFKRPDSWFFKQENVDKAQAFFDRYGAKTIVLARFVPVVRTFAPIVAGVSRMNYRTFVTYNILGGALWAFGITLLGYFLGQVKVVEQNLEIAILTVVAISLLPIVIELYKARRSGRWLWTWPTIWSIRAWSRSPARPSIRTAAWTEPTRRRKPALSGYKAGWAWTQPDDLGE